MAEAWEAGVPAELIPLAKQQFDFVEGTCATVPGSQFESSKKPATHEKWDSISKEKSMEVLRQQQQGKPPLGVGVCFMPLPADVIANYLADSSKMHEWDDDLCEKGQTITVYNPDASLGLLGYYGESALGVQIVAPRELKILTVKKTLPSGVVLVASFSVPDSVGPDLTKGKVRALLLTGGGVIVPKDGGCQVTFLTQIDFGGQLPGAIVAMVAKTQPLALATARDKLVKANKK